MQLELQPNHVHFWTSQTKQIPGSWYEWLINFELFTTTIKQSLVSITECSRMVQNQSHISRKEKDESSDCDCDCITDHNIGLRNEVGMWNLSGVHHEWGFPSLAGSLFLTWVFCMLSSANSVSVCGFCLAGRLWLSKGFPSWFFPSDDEMIGTSVIAS